VERQESLLVSGLKFLRLLLRSARLVRQRGGCSLRRVDQPSDVSTTRALGNAHRVLTFNWQEHDPKQALTALAQGGHLLVPMRRDVGDPSSLRLLFSELVRTSSGRALLCCGGDTARLVCASLGVQAIHSWRRNSAGVTLGNSGGWRARPLADLQPGRRTGNPEALSEAVSFIAAQPVHVQTLRGESQ
jgi:hypothetical protein